MSRRDFHVLYVDAEAQWSKAAAELLDGQHKRLFHVSNDEEAMAYLRGGGPQGHRRPDLILLSLPSHGCPGILSQLKGDDHLRRIPVVVMGPGGNPEDVRRAYDCYANCYVASPRTEEEFKRVWQSLEEFWFGVAKLPGA